jgi:hypothetical protein
MAVLEWLPDRRDTCGCCEVNDWVMDVSIVVALCWYCWVSCEFHTRCRAGREQV